MPPTVSWNALRYVNGMMDEGTPTLEEVCAEAQELGLTHVEWHYGVIQPHTLERIREVRALQDRYGLGVSQWTCAPDFTHPDAAERDRALEEMRHEVDVAKEIGATGVRVTAGCRHEGVSEEQGIEWAVRGLLSLAEYAEPRGVRLGYENHYRDRRWTHEDFSFRQDTFLAIFDRIKDSPVGINFDCSNQLMTHNDPMSVLRVVKHKVWHVHASDRFPGKYDHSVIGEGSVDFDPIFACLAEIGYDGYISLEDNNPEGRDGSRRAVAFIRRKVAEHWPTA
ncbi:MAG TPA: sugar phosphate isomerase/epimerase family protein [Armatimonadota bacterium]|nr:sugar phosphate isomerase/epimerase family protein [Armatimonadota bacterium]